MRTAAYAGISTILAAAVTLRAFHERPNFYSACVYLGQSNASRMILLNMLFLSAGSFVFALQRLLYGPLRPIEIEQLWDKAWYAITETALAMTTFRDEVGGWFFIMFMSLLAGKVWGWIGEGRVEILEQQPPTNPRLFHARLITSLFLSQIFDALMFRYCIRMLLEQPRPGMMVMFAFEFAVLAITSSSAAARYALSLQEVLIVKRQTRAKVEERKQEIRAAREEAQRQANLESSEGAAPAPSNIPAMEEIDESDIDVPGWSEKGRWVLVLDLTTDFLKLVVYLCFFLILLAFHGIPIHIVRDVFLTGRSFIKRINDFIKYRNATKDMNARYPDATAGDLARDGTCIICREDMRPWQDPNPRLPAGGGIPEPARTPTDERQRAKKLPCGHILHFGCLRSWLERQQVCPTCRRPVLSANDDRSGTANANRRDVGNQQLVVRAGENPQERHQPDVHRPQNQNQNGLRARSFGIGRYRITFAAGNVEQVRNALAQTRFGNIPDGVTLQDVLHARQNRRNNNTGTQNLQDQVAELERQIMQEIHGLNTAQDQLATVRALQAELAHLRNAQNNHAAPGPQSAPHVPAVGQNQGPGFPPSSMGGLVAPHFPMPHQHPLPWRFTPVGPAIPTPLPQLQQQVFSSGSPQNALGANHPSLPPGLTLPEGWTLLPLQRTGPPREPPLADQQLEGVTVLPQVQPTVDTTYGPVESSHINPNTSNSATTHTNGDTASNHSSSQSSQSTSNGQGMRQDASSTIQIGTPQTSTVVSNFPAPFPPRPTPTLPSWQSRRSPVHSTQPPTQSSGPGHETASSSEMNGERQTYDDSSESSKAVANGHAPEGKGKGRAVSVEDDVD